jgi:D-3-phosphoglycerate dehydrogenase
MSPAALIDLMPGTVGAIVGDDPLTQEVFEAAEDLRVVVKWGVGVDAIDLEAASRSGVTVVNTPGVFGREVADSALAYVLLLARGHHRVDAAVRRGEWPKLEGVTLDEKVAGVVGLGSIGLEVAKRAEAFGMAVVAFDPYVDEGSTAVQMMPLDGLARESDFLILTCPLTDETRGLIDESVLGAMGSDAFLVNVSRGPVVDELALVRALQEGRIAGAGLDVYVEEPLPARSPLRSLDNVVLGAHNGSNTREGVQRTSAVAVSRLLAELGR